MSQILVVRGDQRPVVIGATGKDSKLQNVYMIMTTPIGSVPQDRNFGISTSMLDTPTPVAKAQVIAEIYEKVQLFEPRVVVQNISFEEDGESGTLIPIVKLIEKE